MKLTYWIECHAVRYSANNKKHRPSCCMLALVWALVYQAWPNATKRVLLVTHHTPRKITKTLLGLIPRKGLQTDQHVLTILGIILLDRFFSNSVLYSCYISHIILVKTWSPFSQERMIQFRYSLKRHTGLLSPSHEDDTLFSLPPQTWSSSRISFPSSCGVTSSLPSVVKMTSISFNSVSLLIISTQFLSESLEQVKETILKTWNNSLFLNYGRRNATSDVWKNWGQGGQVWKR